MILSLYVQLKAPHKLATLNLNSSGLILFWSLRALIRLQSCVKISDMSDQKGAGLKTGPKPVPCVHNHIKEQKWSANKELDLLFVAFWDIFTCCSVLSCLHGASGHPVEEQEWQQLQHLNTYLCVK